ncbi:MAG: capsular biosynthesis protein [Elsteraceae bacterium]
MTRSRFANELPPSYLELEHVYLGTFGRGARTVAVTGVQGGDGASLLAHALAARATSAGLRALYLDLNLFRPSFPSLQIAWRPDDQSVHQALLPRDHSAPFEVAPAPVGASNLLFREPAVLKRLLEEKLVDYDAIVIDTSAICSVNAGNVPPEILAAACDSCVLVMLAGVTKQAPARLAVDRLTAAGAKIAGVVLNDRDNPTLADEMCREVNRLKRWLPNLTEKMCRWIRRKDLLRQPG